MTTGYGVESWCADSLVTGRLVSGWLAVGQACYRRLTTPRGMLQSGTDDGSDPDDGSDEESAYGFDVAGYVGAVGTALAVNALPALVRGELLKDDRVLDVVVDAAISTDSSGVVSVLISCSVTLVNDGQTFDLTLSVAGGEVSLEALQLAA